MRDISSPLDGFSSPFGPQRNRTLQSLLFGQTEPGFTFEPWDITTLYQDRAGTTPVTAAGQSVGLRLSKDQGLRQGPELVTNGDFSTDTWWGKDATCTIGGGTGNFSATPASSGFFKSDILQVGKFYRVTYTIVSISGGAIRILLGAGSSIVRSVAGTYTEIIQCAGSGNLYAQAFSGGPTTASVDNISVRELPGNHQVAVSDAKRGVYGWMPKTGRRNLLTYTEQFDNAAWSKELSSITANFADAPDGTISADRFVSAGGSFPQIFQVATLSAGATYTFSIWVKSDGTSQIAQTLILDGAATSFTPNSTWTRVSVTKAGTSGGLKTAILATNSPTAPPSSFLVWGAQLELGSTATAYQRVVSQYDITEAGVPTCYYVQADGVDDAYVTPTITPNTDKVQVFAGVRKLVDPAATSIIIEHSTVTTNPGTFGLQAARTVAGKPYAIESGGSIPYASLAVTGSAIAPNTSVIAATSDISGDLSTIRINGVQVGQSTADQGTGNYSAYPVYLYSRAGTTNPFNGLDFGHAVRFGPNLDAATIARVEALIARNTPEVTL